MRIRCSLRGLPTAEAVRRACGGFEGHLYTHRWLEPNVTFLKGALNVPGVTEVLRRAVDRLIGQSEHELAAGIREDLPLLNANKENAVVLAPSGFKSGRTPRRASADISGGTLQQDRTCSPARSPSRLAA